jgi:hypothetical protein
LADQHTATLSGVRILVRDTRNILLLYLASASGDEPDEGALASLQAALQRGIEAVFQIDEQELASERIGQADRRGILLWEASEGGLGVLDRLVEDPEALPRVAAAALEICHFTPEGEDLRPQEDLEDGCARACYNCLLSYINQRDHPLLDRHGVRDLLLRLARGAVQLQHGMRDYDEQYRWLLERTDPASDLERQFLQRLHDTGRPLPDEAQPLLGDYPARPDFIYAPARACVFCDGSVHDQAQVKVEDTQIRGDLRDLGYRVIVIRYDQDLEEQIQQYPDLFG